MLAGVTLSNPKPTLVHFAMPITSAILFAYAVIEYMRIHPKTIVAPSTPGFADQSIIVSRSRTLFPVSLQVPSSGLPFTTPMQPKALAVHHRALHVQLYHSTPRHIRVHTDVEFGVPYPPTYIPDILPSLLNEHVSGYALGAAMEDYALTWPSTSYAGRNAAAGDTTVLLARSGFTSYAMNMGQPPSPQ